MALFGAVLVTLGLVVLIAVGGRRVFRSLGEMNRETLAAIDVGSLEAEWLRYERDNRATAQLKLQPGADWRILNPDEHVWVLNELAPAYRVNDDTAPNLRPDGFRDPWGLMYRFEVRQLPGGIVRMRVTSAGRDGQFGIGDDLSELVAVPQSTSPTTQAAP
jgi:hypothetical protein